MFVCAGESEQFSFASPIGIGMTDVAINLTKLCLSQKPNYLIFVGTAGSYGEKNIFDIVESQIATNIENSFFMQKSYTPIDYTVTSSHSIGSVLPSGFTKERNNSVLVSEGSHVSRETIVNSSNYITTDEGLSKFYLEKNITIENMEYYAVLKVAKYFDIPAKGIFIVTNYCNRNAHKDFLTNHKEAMNRLTQYIKERE